MRKGDKKKEKKKKIRKDGDSEIIHSLLIISIKPWIKLSNFMDFKTRGIKRRQEETKGNKNEKDGIKKEK